MPSSSPTLGTLLRRLRAREGWTLKEMSERTGIPVSTLSKVEHDRLTLTYDKLQQLSQPPQHPHVRAVRRERRGQSAPAVTARRSIGDIDRAVRVNTPNYDYYYLCPELRRKRMIPVLTRIRRARPSRSSASSCTTRARNSSTSSRAGSRSTPSSTIRSCWTPASHLHRFEHGPRLRRRGRLRRGRGARRVLERRRGPDAIADEPARRKGLKLQSANRRRATQRAAPSLRHAPTDSERTSRRLTRSSLRSI